MTTLFNEVKSRDPGVASGVPFWSSKRQKFVIVLPKIPPSIIIGPTNYKSARLPISFILQIEDYSHNVFTTLYMC
jgi:hypothetical protein